MKRVLLLLVLLLLSVLIISMAGNKAPAALAQEPVESVTVTPGPLLRDRSERGVETPRVSDPPEGSPLMTGSRGAATSYGGMRSPSPAKMDPPGSCGVPLGGPFGKDVEILLNDVQYQYGDVPGWHRPAGIPRETGDAKPSSDVAAAALSTEKIAAVWRESGQAKLYYSIWDSAVLVEAAWESMAGGGPFSDASGFYYEQHYSTVQTADVDGDGRDELLGRSKDGMQTYRFDSENKRWELIIEKDPPFSDEDGWGDPKYYSTIQTADVDGDGRDELLARGPDGMHTYRFDSTNKRWELVAAGDPAWSDTGGWTHPQFYSTIQTADVDGDGRDELLARGYGGLGVQKYSDSEGWEHMAGGGPFSDADGWAAHQYYSTIQTADVDGDGRDELFARGPEGWLETYRFESGSWEPVAERTLAFKTWTWPQYYSTIQTADVDGDGRDELLGRDSNGVITFRLSKDGKEWEAIVHHDPPLSDKQDWAAPRYYSTIQTADVDGDGRDELLARGPEGMRTYRFNSADKRWELVLAGNPPWADNNGWAWHRFYSTIQTADADGDGQDELLARGAGGMGTVRFSFSRGGWAAEEGWVGPSEATSLGYSEATVKGNPAILTSGGQSWEVYARTGAGRIKVIALEGGAPGKWQAVPNTVNVVSDPVVVSRRKGNTLLFYRDGNGAVWFTEREGGVVWRDRPLSLTPSTPTASQLFLPIVIQASSTTAAAPSLSPASGHVADPPSSFKSELSAISRNENHVSLFGVDDQGQLWVKDWTALNEPDWSDTKWVRLMEGVEIEKPAVASRHSNHMAVAIRDTSGKAALIEWNAQSGWGAPESVYKQLRFSGPLALAVPDTNELFLIGADKNNVVRSLLWTAGSGWQKPQTGPDAGDPDQVIATAVRRPDDVMILARAPEKGLYWHYTSQGQGLEADERPAIEPPTAEQYRNQVLARVNNRSYYIALDNAGGKWQVEAYDLIGDEEQTPRTLDGHAYISGKPVSVVAADVDFDGSDELLVATYAGEKQAQVSVVDLSVKKPDTAPVLRMEIVAAATETFDKPVVDFALAAGDLNGDARRNEVIVAATLGGSNHPLHAVAKIYQFVSPDMLEQKSKGFRPIDVDSPFDGHWELEIATGRLSKGQSAEQLVVAITGEQNNSLRGFVNTYSIETGTGHWSLKKKSKRLADKTSAFEGSSDNLHRSAVATGDLDADGSEEIAAWYLDRVTTIDTNDLDDNGNPTARFVPLEPKGDDGPYQSPRSLALDDIDRDGRLEIAAAARLYDPEYDADNEFGYRFALLELLGGGGLQLTGYGPAQSNRDHGTVLMGDVDGDGLVSELVGCQEFGEYMVVAVVNGLPRPYKNGAPLFDSSGSFSKEEDIGTSVEAGVTMRHGASLCVEYEQEFEAPIPFLGLDIGGVSASVTGDFMQSLGASESREVIDTYGDDYEFEGGLGLVVYNVVTNRCYYHDLFSPASPQQKTRAMTCLPAGSGTGVMSLDLWHAQSTKDSARDSWVDVGHRAPDGTLTNNLDIPGNYQATLPVDNFKLLHSWENKLIAPQGQGISRKWYASEATGGALQHFHSLEANVTVAAGVKTGNVKVEGSRTVGAGSESSFTESWSNQTAFAGGYSWPAATGRSYIVRPYVYWATAKSLVGTTYPYFEMDYYVPTIGQ